MSDHVCYLASFSLPFSGGGRNLYFFQSSGGSPFEGHNAPRGSPRKFASQGALRGPLRGLCGVSPRVLRGLCGALRGSAEFSEGFRGSDPMLVTLGNCWNFSYLFRRPEMSSGPGKQDRNSLGFGAFKCDFKNPQDPIILKKLRS